MDRAPANIWPAANLKKFREEMKEEIEKIRARNPQLILARKVNETTVQTADGEFSLRPGKATADKETILRYTQELNQLT